MAATGRYFESYSIKSSQPILGHFTLISHVGAGPSPNGITTGAIDTTLADLLIVSTSYYSGGGTDTISDSYGNTWILAGTHTSGFVVTEMWYVKSAVSGTGHTFTMTGTGIFGAINVLAFSGSNLTSPLDQQTFGTSSGTLTMSASHISLTPTNANSLLVTGISIWHEPTLNPTIDLSFIFTDGNVYDPVNGFGSAMAYKIQTAIVTENPTWTFNIAPSQADGIFAIFKT